MIELPEAMTLADQLLSTVAGRRIEKAEAGHTPHGFAFYQGDPATYRERLSGSTITAAGAWGGHVEIETDGERLVLNDGINLRLLPADAARPTKRQLLLELDDGTALVCSVQMYGGMLLYAENPADIANPYYRVAHDTPSPLSDAFDFSHFAALADGLKPSTSAKAFLATQQRIPGLGNGCLHDILWDAKVNPRTKLADLPAGEAADAKGEPGTFAALYGSVKHVLADMADGGGRDTEKDLFGKPGGYATRLSAKTWQDPCPECGATIVREAYLGGKVYYCPTCQPRP